MKQLDGKFTSGISGRREASVESVRRVEENILQKYREELSQHNLEKNVKIWNEKFDLKATNVFSEKGFEYLEKMPMEQRLAILRLASRDYSATPGMVEEYFKKFPRDIEVLIENYEMNGINTSDGFMITSLAALSMIEYAPYLKRDLAQYIEISERRKLMPKILMDDLSYQKKQELFGDAMKEYSEVFSDASKLEVMGKNFLDMKRLFGAGFKALSPSDKSMFLRSCVADLHNSLVATEGYNSCFTAQHVRDNNERTKNSTYYGYNSAHSMIFKTYQPSKAYELAQKVFQRDMDSTAMRGGLIEEYPFHRMLLKVLEQFNEDRVDKGKNVEVLVDFWNKNRNPIFANFVAEALNKQNSNIAAKKLLKILHDDNTEQKNAIAAILYRLEFGRINISKQGVKYLEKMYDLGEMNNPNYFVNRLTANGDIGVFDESKELMGYFNVKEGLEGKEQIIKPEVLEFTVETLFFEKEGETEKEKQEREKYLQEFKENYFDFYDDEFVKRTGTRFNNLGFKEQGQFLIYYKNADKQQREKLLDFIKKYQETGFKTFLSLEQGVEMGKKILKIGNKFDGEDKNPEIAKAIFRKYGKLVDAVDVVGDYLREEFGRDDPKIIQEIQENLLMRGKAILVMFADEEMTEEEVMERLREINSGVDVLGSVLKAMKDGGENIDFEVIKGLKIEKREIKFKQGLSLVEKEEVLQIFKKSYKKIFSDNPNAYKRVINNIETQLNNLAGQIVYVMKHKDKVVAFCRFKKNGNEVEGASLVVDEDIQGLNVGGYFVDSTTKDISSEYAIRIKSRKNNPANNDYQKKGYEIIGEHTKKDGVEYYDMRMPARGEQGLRVAA